MSIIDIITNANANLFRNKLRTALNILAIFVAALTLCLTIGISNGLTTYLNTLFDTVEAPSVLIISKKDDSGGNILASLEGLQEYKEDAAQKNQFGQSLLDIEKLKSDTAGMSNIEKIYPALRGNTAILYAQYGDGKKYTILTNVMGDGLKVKLSSGRNMESKDEIVIPQKLAEIYDKKPEDMIGNDLTLVYMNYTGEKISKNVKIVGVATQTLFTSNLYINYELAKEISSALTPLGVAERTTYPQGVAVLKKYDAATIDEMKSELDKLGYSAITYADQTKTINDFLGSVQYGLLAFAAIALIAASFGIINTMIISVLERTKEIGLSKALGMSSVSVFMTFLIESVLLGFWGASIGIGISIIIGNILNKVAADSILKGFPGFNLFVFDPMGLLMVLGVICGVCFVAGSLPSLRASRYNPIEALRYE